MHQELTGIIDKFIFQLATEGYHVFVLRMSATQTAIVRGHAPALAVGQQVCASGLWTTHVKFGPQFEAQSIVVQLPTSVVGIKKYLGSGLIKGIGPVYAQKLVDYFGMNVLEVIDQHPERLHEVPGIGGKRVEQITAAWQEQKSIAQLMVFLQEKGVSPLFASKIYKTYGPHALAVVTENPYRLAEDIWGVGFKTADVVAQKMGIAPDSPARLRAALLFAITAHTGHGHLYIELDELKRTTAELLELPADTSFKNPLYELHEKQRIKVVSVQEQHFVVLSQHYHTEKGVAARLKGALASASTLSVNLDAVYTTLRTQSNEQELLLNEQQQKGVLACLHNKVTIITGGPGTGKTTLIKKLLGVLDEYQLTYKLAAPTGRAAKRMAQSTGRFALTIHRLLEYDAATRGFSRNDQNALGLDILIVDEASMIDIFLAHALLKALPYNAHVVFIGDVDQLPAVGAGNFLNDLIASGVASCIRLTEIFRQAQDSLIIVNAHRVNSGEFPISYLPDAKRDFLFIKEDDPANVAAHLQTIFTHKLRSAGINPEDATVLVPMNKGVVGTQNINRQLQELLNPARSDVQVHYHGTAFKVNDRVMQIRNNYDKSVFNGDIGTLESIDMVNKTLSVRYFERVVPYEWSELDELVLAYAISIHKSQGSEYDAVIIPIFMQHFTLLARNLVYTAITRAKKRCILIGQPRAIAMAIKNNKSVERTTFLRQYLTTDLQCR